MSLLKLPLEDVTEILAVLVTPAPLSGQAQQVYGKHGPPSAFPAYKGIARVQKGSQGSSPEQVREKYPHPSSITSENQSIPLPSPGAPNCPVGIPTTTVGLPSEQTPVSTHITS